MMLEASQTDISATFRMVNSMLYQNYRLEMAMERPRELMVAAAPMKTTADVEVQTDDPNPSEVDTAREENKFNELTLADIRIHQLTEIVQELTATLGRGE
jgi:hypothetical protein